MHPDKEKFLCDNFSFFGKNFYFECGDGWFEIIKDFSQRLSQLKKPFLDYIKIQQVKEKFGSLTIYYSTEEYLIDEKVDFIEGLIRRAQEKSKGTCELCGNPGKLQKRKSMYLARCKDCVNK